MVVVGTHCGCLQQRDLGEWMGVAIYKSTNEIFGTKVRKYMSHIGSLLPILVDCGYFFKEKVKRRLERGHLLEEK